MADANEAAAPATEANPTQNSNEPATQSQEQAPEKPTITPEQVAEYLGTSPETLGKFTKFVEANGKFDSAFSKMKNDISNPEKPAEKPAEQQPIGNTDKLSEQPQRPATPPKGAITADEMMAKYYFEQLSRQEKYAAIKDKIADGSLLSEMKDLGIEIRNPDGSFNDAKINTYLGIKAQTVPAKQNTTSPAEGSAAPTVDYADVGEKITTAEQAYKVITQPGHPKTADAEAFLKEMLNKGR